MPHARGQYWGGVCGRGVGGPILLWGPQKLGGCWPMWGPKLGSGARPWERRAPLQALLWGCPAPPLWDSERPQSPELDGGRRFGARIPVMRLLMRVSVAEADGCVGKNTGSGSPRQVSDLFWALVSLSGFWS